MIPEILHETLSFLDRSSLESCQLVGRHYLGAITKSNAALALRPMDLLSMSCAGWQDGILQFRRHATDEAAGEEVDLKIGTDWSQAQTVAEQAVTRTRNMCISCVSFWCVVCASSFIALWRDTFKDHMPCRAIELRTTFNCSLNSDIDFRQLFQPFASSKLGVVRYEVPVYDDERNEQDRAEFDALWSAWDRPTAQFVTLKHHGSDAFTYALEQVLHELGHDGPHYTVEGYSRELLKMVDNYVQKFEFGGSELSFPASLAFYRFSSTNRTVHTLRHPALRTLGKPPQRNIPDPSCLRLGHLIEESSCNVYEIRNLLRRQMMHAYFWVTTRRLYRKTAIEDHYYHCHWFTMATF